MTTKLLENKSFTFKILLSWHFPQKIAFWTIFLSAHPCPPPPEKRKFIFIVVSLSLIHGKELDFHAKELQAQHKTASTQT